MVPTLSPMLRYILSTLKTHGHTSDARIFQNVLSVLQNCASQLTPHEQQIAGQAIREVLRHRAANRQNKIMLPGVIDDRTNDEPEEDT